MCRSSAALRKDARHRILDVTAKRKLGLVSGTSPPCITSSAVNQGVIRESNSETFSPDGKRRCLPAAEEMIERIGIKSLEPAKGIAVFEYFSGIGYVGVLASSRFMALF